MEKELEEGISSSGIGYFSFTKKASNEAKERAIQKFPHLNEKIDFPWFRTLHSLAFRCLHISANDIMKPENYREFSKETGIEINIELGEEEFMVRADNPILSEINIARIKGEDLRAYYNRSNLDIEWHHFEYVERAYRHYKQSRELIDFTDMLEQIVNEPDKLPALEALIIDEAQDLSRLQWNLVEILANPAILGVTLAIAAVGAIALYVYDNWQAFSDRFKNIWINHLYRKNLENVPRLGDKIFAGVCGKLLPCPPYVPQEV